MTGDGLKQCPFCKESIRNEAIKCRFCGEWLERPEPSKSLSHESKIVSHPTEVVPPSQPDAGERQTPENLGKKGIPVQTLETISGVLLAGCAILVVIGFALVPWRNLTPYRQGELIGKAVGALVMVLICAGLACRTEKRKGYKLLWFSIVCTFFTLVGAYYFAVGVRESRQANKHLEKGVTDLYTN
jgi:hypothetical protein